MFTNCLSRRPYSYVQAQEAIKNVAPSTSDMGDEEDVEAKATFRTYLPLIYNSFPIMQGTFNVEDTLDTYYDLTIHPPDRHRFVCDV